jgi:hypothetical protein
MCNANAKANTMANTPNPVTVSFVNGEPVLESNGEHYVMVLRRNTWWLFTKGNETNEELAWDGWSTTEAEALGHAIACVGYNA